MTLIASFLLVIASLAAITARWTSLHPLVVALIAGLPGGLLGLLVAAGALSPAVWPVAALGFILTAVCGSFGAFIGWLRRDFVRRNK